MIKGRFNTRSPKFLHALNKKLMLFTPDPCLTMNPICRQLLWLLNKWNTCQHHSNQRNCLWLQCTKAPAITDHQLKGKLSLASLYQLHCNYHFEFRRAEPVRVMSAPSLSTAKFPHRPDPDEVPEIEIESDWSDDEDELKTSRRYNYCTVYLHNIMSLTYEFWHNLLILALNIKFPEFQQEFRLFAI